MKFIVNLTMLFASLGMATPAFAAGRLTDADFKTLSQIQAAGGTQTQLLNTSKIYDPTLNDTLANGIAGGAIGGSGGSGGVELLTNPTFESGVTSGWTASGLTASAATSGTNLIAGAKSALLTPTATGQTFKSAALAVKGLAGGKCAASMYYIMSGTGWTLSVVDGSANTLASAVLPVSASGSIPQTVKFVCPASATATVQFVLTSTSATQTLAFDNAHLGSDNTAIVSNSNVNYITDTDAESGQVGAWATYLNTAQALPVTGTGGSPTVTFGVVNTAPLFGLNSYVFTHPASNTQGQGVAIPFTIDSGAQAKPLQINIPYSVASGTYSGGTATTDSDLEAYVYDVTNAQIIQPTAFKFDCAVVGTQCQVFANFQSASNSTSYRLILHNATTTAQAYAIKLDNIQVTPTIKTFGVPASDWQTYTMNIGAVTTAPTKGTVQTDKAQWRRVGSDMEIRYDYYQTAAGTAGSGTYLFPIPSGYSIDSTRLPVLGNNAQIVGDGKVSATTGSTGPTAPPAHVLQYQNTNNLFLAYIQTSVENTIAVGSGAYALNDANQSYSFTAKVPIAGWSSNVQLSDQSGDGRVVAFRAYKTATQSIPATTGTTLTGFTVTSDTHGAWDATNSRYITPVPGFYKVAAQNLLNTNSYVNSMTVSVGAQSYSVGSSGVADRSGGYVLTDFIPAGTSIQAILYTGGPTTVQAGAQNTYITVERLSGNSQTAIGESVNATYGLTTAQSVAANSVIKYDTKVKDTHNAYSTATGLFTAPTSGQYRISVTQLPGSNCSTYIISTNGLISPYITNSGSGSLNNGDVSIPLLAGQTVGVAIDAAATMNAIVSGRFVNYVTIERTGN